MSPSYPSPYPAKTTCRYEFQGRGKERVQIVFQDFNLYHSSDNPKDCDNQDSLIAFVHLEGRMEKIDNFCGTALPKPVMSNGPRLKLEFQSLIASRYSRGFKATYSFTESFLEPITSGLDQKGCETTEDDPRPGRPSVIKTDENIEKIGRFIREDRRVSIRGLAEITGIDKECVRQILHESFKVCAKMVPKLLNPEQKESRMNIGANICTKQH
ncbi:hypothetical protein NQ318_012276 [Aromia moschata]|uniref:CUB domain-containing protein n=1 Tax=Aromia moschata TaxID=1265417 RepID=A0AAV8XGA5_9CUCU|nr:hypothetical protein NQ318_012276 [Aromia moschata]